MKKLIGLALLSTTLCSCLAGPHQLKRTVDDFDRKLYVESPWVDAVLWVVPVFPLLGFGAQIGDFFVVDAYHFWLNDAWDQEGTGFRHFDVDASEQLESLLYDDAAFLSAQ